MTTFLSSNRALKLLYSGNAVKSAQLSQATTGWTLTPLSALIHFGFRQKLMMQKLSHRKRSTDAAVRSTPSGDAWHHDIMAYLGGMNTSLAVLASLRLYALFRPSSALVSTGSAKGDVPLDFLALVVLGVGNFSQAFANFTIGARTDRWIMGKGLDRITVLDAVFTVLDWTAAFGRVSML